LDIRFLALKLLSRPLIYPSSRGFSLGQYYGINTITWFYLSIAFPIIHQIYVWFCWRTQLHYSLVTRLFGARGFTYYATGFFTLAVYLFYSVGIDHFDSSYGDRPLVKEGIYRYVNNGMYLFGVAIIWIPGLVYLSKAALLSALFTHLYIWVHYYCTEKPDMKRIYDSKKEK